MKKNLLGNHIPCSCSYCKCASEQNGEFSCSKQKSIGNDGTCSYFQYDPLKRVPRPAPKLPCYTPEDFSL